MTIFNRGKKGSFALESLEQSGPKYVTTEFGTKVLEEEEKVEDAKEYDEKKEDVEDAGDFSNDLLVSVIGEFGKYQVINVTLMGFTGFIFSWLNFENKFLTYEVDFWCAKPPGLNVSLDTWLNMSAPYVDEEYDRCNIFNVDFTESMSRPSENTTTIACTAWEFATKPFQNTVMQRWSLVCDNDFYFKSISQSLFFAGHFFGTLIAGYLSDRFGRKRAFILTLLPAIGLTLGSYFVDNPYGWMALRFFIGLVQMAGTTIKAVYAVEWTSGKWRSFAQHYFVEIFFLTAQMTMGLLVYLVPDMRTLELVICIGIIPYLSYEFILPESPRWLISKGRIDEAKAILAKALKMNNLPMSRLDKLDKVSQAEIVTEPSKDAFFTDLLKLPGARRNLLCISFCWFTFTMGYYGLIYNTPSFGWNLYITFCMPAFFTLPMLALQPFLENKLGRKPLMAFLMFLSGTLLLCTLAIPDGMFNHNWPVMVFAWIGTVACSTAFGVGIVLTKDLFPTTHRTMAFSMASASARLGSISSPYIALLANVSPLLGLAVYGCFLFIGAIVSIWIWPDTKNTKVPDTLEECEAMASSKNTWLFCCN